MLAGVWGWQPPKHFIQMNARKIGGSCCRFRSNFGHVAVKSANQLNHAEILFNQVIRFLSLFLESQSAILLTIQLKVKVKLLCLAPITDGMAEVAKC